MNEVIIFRLPNLDISLSFSLSLFIVCVNWGEWEDVGSV